MKLAVWMRAMPELYLFDRISTEKAPDGLQQQEPTWQVSIETN